MKKFLITLLLLLAPVQVFAAQPLTPDQEQRAQKMIADFLFNDPNSPRIGAKNPKLTLVVFTDYNCPYCKNSIRTWRRSSKNIRTWRWSLSFYLSARKVR
jgi:protein-disulfide isomerase